MAIRYKVDVMAELKKKGYTSTKIREEKLIGQSYLQQLRHGELVSWKTLELQQLLQSCKNLRTIFAKNTNFGYWRHL